MRPTRTRRGCGSRTSVRLMTCHFTGSPLCSVLIATTLRTPGRPSRTTLRTPGLSSLVKTSTVPRCTRRRFVLRSLTTSVRRTTSPWRRRLRGPDTSRPSRTTSTRSLPSTATPCASSSCPGHVCGVVATSTGAASATSRRTSTGPALAWAEALLGTRVNARAAAARPAATPRGRVFRAGVVVARMCFGPHGGCALGALGTRRRPVGRRGRGLRSPRGAGASSRRGSACGASTRTSSCGHVESRCRSAARLSERE